MSAYVKIPLQLLILVDRRPRLRLLPVPDAADAVQPRLRRAASRRARTRRSTRRSSGQFDRGDRRARGKPRSRRPRRVSREPTHAWPDIRGRASAIVKQTTGDKRYTRRQLRVSDLHHDAHADRPGRADDRRDFRGGDVGQRRRAQRARHGDRSSTSTGGISSRDASDTHYLHGVEAGDDRLGTLRVRRGDVRRESGIADRGREPVRIVLLRLAARRVHAGDSRRSARRPPARSGASSPEWPSS